MEAIIVKYVQLICVTIFMGGNANCATLMGKTEESNNLKIAACVADCLKTELNYVSQEFFRVFVGISNLLFVKKEIHKFEFIL